MQYLAKKLALGFGAGLAGAAAMSLVMAVGKALGIVNRPKPHRIEERIEEKTGKDDEISPEQGVILAQGMHMLIGAAYGAGYSLLQSLINLPALIFGPIYGMGVYVINEIIAGPSLDLSPPPNREPQHTVVRRVMLHLLFGLVIGSILQYSKNSLGQGFSGIDRKREIQIG